MNSIIKSRQNFVIDDEIAKKFLVRHHAVSDRLRLAGVTRKKAKERNEEKNHEFIAMMDISVKLSI